MRAFSLVAALVLSPAVPNLVAQRLETLPRFDAAAVFQSSQDRVRVGDYGLEGLAVGAGVVGLLGVVLASSLCGNDGPGVTCSPNSGTSFLVGAAIGAGIGYLVGRTIPKYAAPSGP